jgi:hypothetical protein
VAVRRLAQREVQVVIPQKQRPAHWRRRRGHPPHFDGTTYRRRIVIERCVGWLKEHRRGAMREDA